MSSTLYHSIALGCLVVLAALEASNPTFRRDCATDRERLRRNWAYLVASTLAVASIRRLTERFDAWLPKLVDWGQTGESALLLQIAACFVVGEGLGYFLHWLKHKSIILWDFHFQHHRDAHYSIWLTAHTHAGEVLLSSVVVSGSLVLLGFELLVTQAYLLFYSVANTYQHSSHNYTLGWLDRLIVSPAYHRLHHTVDSDCNYGNTLTLWDVFFRTAIWPSSRARPQPELGLSADAPEPMGFWAEMFYFLSRRS